MTALGPTTPSLGLRRVALPNAALRLVGQGGEFAAFLVFARRLGPAGFGSLSSAFLLCRFAGMAGDWGASVFGARLVATGQLGAVKGLLRRRLTATAALGAVAAVALVGLRGPAALPLVVTLLARGSVLDWIALGRHDPLRAAGPAAIQGVGCAAGSVLVSTVAGSVVVLAVAYGVALALSCALNAAYLGELRRTDTGHVPTEPWSMVFVFADQIYASADVLLLNVLASSKDAGVYAALYRFPNAAITVGGLLIAGLVPGAARAVAEGGGPRLRQRGARLGAGLATLAVAGIVPAYALVRPVFGAAYLPGRSALVLLLLSVAVVALSWGVQPVYLSSGPIRPLALWAAVVATVNIAANLALIPVFGLVGAASATLLAQALIAGFYFVRSAVLVRPPVADPVVD